MLNKIKYLILIVVLAAVLRLAGLSANPPSLNWDEISHGYNAYSILKTGKDEWGVSLPLIFRAYGDYKLPVYIYLTAADELVFGLTPLAVRLPSALAGIGTVALTYFLVLGLFKGRRNLALTSALLVAVEPWSLFLSRGAFEANLGLFLIVSGIYFFLKSLQRPRYLILAAVLLGLSVWTYNSARIFVPLLLTVMVIIYWPQLKKKVLLSRKLLGVSVLLFALFFIPMFFQLANPAGQARYGKVAILDEGAIAKIEAARNSSKLPSFLNRLVNNRVSYFAYEFTKNWFSHYSPSFLFFSGGTNYQFSVPGRGLLYLLNLPFFVLGLIYLLKNYRERSTKLILAWLLLAPVASSLTREAPHLLRAIVMLPVPMVISTLGFFWVFKNKIIIALYTLALLLFLENYLVAYFTGYREKYSWAWQYGYKEAVEYVKSIYHDYDKIIVTKKYGEPHEFLLFYWPWNPASYRLDPNLIRYNQSNWWWVDRFDKFYFVNDWQVKDLVTESKIKIDCRRIKCLLVTSPGNFPAGWGKLETINFPGGQPAFEIYDNR